MASKTKEIIFPERASRIAEVGSVITYQGGQDTIFGIEVIMENGDSFSYWNPDKVKLQFFKPGVTLLYALKKSITDEGTENEKIKVRLDTFDFIIPRKTRAELEIVRKINDSIVNAQAHAKDILLANPKLYTSAAKGIDIETFREQLALLAESFHNQTKSMLIAESYGDVEL